MAQQPQPRNQRRDDRLRHRSDDQPRAYRCDIYDGRDRILRDRQYLLVVDLTPGEGIRATERALNAILYALAVELRRGTAEQRRRLQLDVIDLDTKRKTFRWVATDVYDDEKV